MSDIAIRAEEVSKLYRIGMQEKQHDSLSGAIMSTLKSPFRSFKKLQGLSSAGKNQDAEDIVWALKDISFDVNHGDVLGIIGRNGAGKSTLLKIFSRITDPSFGKIIINGRVASLLEVGTGFHMELTGRENVFLNGTILGMRKHEIASKFDEILAFSGVEKYIDTPVKRYSSGMKVRLAFSVAAHLDPEILLIDEVLAVGDASFQKKCLSKMDDVAKGGRTVLFVSHQLGMVRTLCNKGVLLKNGQLDFRGDMGAVLARYEKSIESKYGNNAFVEFSQKENVVANLVSASMQDRDGNAITEFDVFDDIFLEVRYRVNEPTDSMVVGTVIERNGETLFYSQDTDINPERYETRYPGLYVTKVKLPSPLKAGRFVVHISIGRINSKAIDSRPDVFVFDVIEKSFDPSLKSYYSKRIGVIATELDWQITNFEPKAILESESSK